MSAAKIGQKQNPNLLGFFQSERESISAVRQIYKKVMIKMFAKRIFCVSIILFVKNIIFATISVEPIVIGLSGIFY